MGVPADVFHGCAHAITAVTQRELEDVLSRHPARLVSGEPKPTAPQAIVLIKPLPGVSHQHGE